MQCNKDSREQFVGTILSVLQKSGDSNTGINSQVVGDSVSVGDATATRAQDHPERSQSKTRTDGSQHVSRPLRDWIALCMVVSMMVVASILFILAVASSSLFSTINQPNNNNNNTRGSNNQHQQQDKGGNYGGGQTSRLPARAAKTDSSLYKCELSYLQMDSSLIKFAIDHLIVVSGNGSKPSERPHGDELGAQQVGKDGPLRDARDDEAPFTFDSIDFNSTVDELMASTRLDPKLPFIFFINGFNTLKADSEISDTWMFDVAKSMSIDSLKRSSRRRVAAKHQSQPDGGGPMLLSRLFDRLLVGFNRPGQLAERRPAAGSKLRANVIFLTWSIPDIFADNLLAMVPAYYKTVANYELIVDFVAETIKKTVRFVERARSIGAKSTGASGWSSQEERSQYFLGFEFYGHSLGSHILSDAIRQVRLTLGLGAKFGKLTGLDPATPCFLSIEHGISMSKVAGSVNELVVVHSNAGLAGLTSERADTEIVLNGGTFQPGCRWYDFACHHSRSTAILRYRDDECQMVAYKCPSYHHFKNGACETCDQLAAPGAMYDSFERRSNLAGKIQHRQHQSGQYGRNHTDVRTRMYDSNEQSESQNGSSSSSSSSLNEGADQAPEAPASKVRNCVLVNLPEQHLDSERVLQFAEHNNQIRRLADEDDGDGDDRAKAIANEGTPRQRRKPVPSWRRRRPTRSARPSLRGTDTERAKKAYYHYVNTSPNFRSGRKSHCLQHYQLRLIMYHKNGDDKRIEQRCRPSGHLLNSDEPEIRLALLYEPEPMRKVATGSVGSKDASYASGDKQLLLFEDRVAPGAPRREKVKLSGREGNKMGSNTIGLDAIIKDMLHTTLLTIEREPKLFVGALVDNIDLGKLIDCYVRENATSGPHFVLDVAFMSHTNQKVRHAYSSVLCAQLELNKKSTSDLGARGAAAPSPGRISSSDGNKPSDGTKKTGNGDTNTASDQLQLMLSLCKQSDLMDVSAEIDKLLNHIELHRIDDSWKVSLLNNLFSLFAEWEPF